MPEDYQPEPLTQAAAWEQTPFASMALPEAVTHERRLWELFRQAPGFICILRGPDHVFAFANDSCLRLVGGRDLVGKPLLEALPEIATQGFVDILDEVYRTGEPYTSFEAPIQFQRLPSGALDQRFLDFVYQPIKDSQGRTSGIFVEGLDATERVRAQAALHEGEARINRQRRFYEAILTNTPDHAYIFDLDHRFIYTNDPLLEALGESGEGAVGKSFLELGYPDWHAAKHDREIEQVIATKQPVRGQVAFVGPLGRRIYDYIFTPVMDESGEVEAVAGTTRDITELKQTRKATARLASIVDSSDDAIISKDLRGNILSWNRSAERMFGYSAEEARGRYIGELIIPDDRQEEETNILRQVARGETIDRFETVRRRKDGSTLDISVTISPLCEEGRIIGASKIARDITERKRAERHRDLLINELNHRVKNMLATVQSLAMQSLSHASSLEQGQAALEARLQALAKAHKVLTRENWQFADLRNIVTSTTAAFSTPDRAPRFDLEGADLRLHPQAALTLALVLHELATNATKYGALSGERGHVIIHWRLTGDGEDGRAVLRLHWKEREGPPVTPPQRGGSARG